MQELALEYAKVAAYIAGGIVMAVATIGPGLAQGRIGAQALESIGKYPESAGQVRTSMILAMGLVEAMVIFATILAFVLILVKG